MITMAATASFMPTMCAVCPASPAMKRWTISGREAPVIAKTTFVRHSTQAKERVRKLRYVSYASGISR